MREVGQAIPWQVPAPAVTYALEEQQKAGYEEDALAKRCATTRKIANANRRRRVCDWDPGVGYGWEPVTTVAAHTVYVGGSEWRVHALLQPTAGRWLIMHELIEGHPIHGPRSRLPLSLTSPVIYVPEEQKGSYFVRQKRRTRQDLEALVRQWVPKSCPYSHGG